MFKKYRHGWVYPRRDGQRAKCGGPDMCSLCSNELLEYEDSFDHTAFDLVKGERYVGPDDFIYELVDGFLIYKDNEGRWRDDFCGKINEARFRQILYEEDEPFYRKRDREIN